MTWNFELKKEECPVIMGKGKVNDKLQKANFSKKDAFNCTKWRKSVWAIKNGKIWPPSMTGITVGKI